MAHNFDLRNDGDEDYLSFDFPGDNSPPSPRARPAPVPKSRPVPKRSAAPTRVQHRPQPSLPDNIYDLPDHDTTSPNKKVPLKQVGEHQQLMNTLNAYAASERFHPILDKCGIKIKDLNSKSLAELKELRERVRACCANSGGSGQMVAVGMLGMCSVVEATTPKKLADLTGYRAVVERNPEFHALSEMIALDSGFLTNMSPIQKMIMCLGLSAAEVAATNAAKNQVKNATTGLLDKLKAQQQAQEQPVPPIAPTPVSALQSTPDPLTASMYD